ncbi:MAG TPA: SRPBCC family protein, partial [Acidimicrobiales bacterium]
MTSARPDSAPTAVASAPIAASADDVWRYRLDFMNLSSYNPDVTDVERVTEGEPQAVGGALGAGARYTFQLADPGRPGTGQRIELWIVDAKEPTLVAAGMSGASDAYEEFVVDPLGAGHSEAVLSLWLTLPEGLDEDTQAAAAAGALAQIEKEVQL